MTADCVTFNKFLESLLSTQNTTEAGAAKLPQSPWLGTPAGNTIFTLAKDRVYRKIVHEKGPPKPFFGDQDGRSIADEEALRAMELEEDDEEAREKEAVRKAIAQVEEFERTRDEIDERKKRLAEKWQREHNTCIPAGIEEILEPQPKWGLLAAVLEEIEEDLHWAPIDTGKLVILLSLIFTNNVRSV